ncbi:transposase [Lactococcus plantarum]|uniref:Transposase n=1 Tax=Pseudolactococcus plantarum TaxID=1365 RepID=A0A2A5RYG8_9LACT|nr:transposase [Lactococcus plantarum]
MDMTKTIPAIALNVRLICQLIGVLESNYYERISCPPSKTQLRR